MRADLVYWSVQETWRYRSHCRSTDEMRTDSLQKQKSQHKKS